MHLKSQIDQFEYVWYRVSSQHCYHFVSFPIYIFTQLVKNDHASSTLALLNPVISVQECQVLRLFQNDIRYYWLEGDVQDLQDAGKIIIINEAWVN